MRRNSSHYCLQLSLFWTFLKSRSEGLTCLFVWWYSRFLQALPVERLMWRIWKHDATLVSKVSPSHVALDWQTPSIIWPWSDKAAHGSIYSGIRPRPFVPDVKRFFPLLVRLVWSTFKYRCSQCQAFYYLTDSFPLRFFIDRLLCQGQKGVRKMYGRIHKYFNISGTNEYLQKCEKWVMNDSSLTSFFSASSDGSTIARLLWCNYQCTEAFLVALLKIFFCIHKTWDEVLFD
jgi:hypothetical protein